MGFTKEQLESFRGVGVPDLIGPQVLLLFVGINPGLWTAATQTHFCHPSNRFYPALRRAGVLDWSVDPEHGMTAEQRDDFVRRGMGITNLVNRATIRASELSRAELRAGGQRVRRLVDDLAPAVVAVAGVTAFREAFATRDAALGRQPDDLGPSQLWVVPNPSGLNAHETIETLADWYRRVADAAGLA
ncbi:MAG TPA: mismatch-specific DNA-glycosylase [Acidimicrobiia bacterium]|nr:mismatch-specific DNA-glycosylase [Acidimicrobiia bacterium]